MTLAKSQSYACAGAKHERPCLFSLNEERMDVEVFCEKDPGSLSLSTSCAHQIRVQCSTVLYANYITT